MLIGTACSTPHTPKEIALDIRVEGAENGRIYLCEIENIHYGSAKVIDTLTVENGHAAYANDTLLTGLYAFASQINRYGYPIIEGDFFLQPRTNRFRYTVADDEQQTVAVEPLALQQQYETFQQHLKEINAATDSINTLFYAAREKGDKDEMARQKEASLPYYEKASQEKSEYRKTRPGGLLELGLRMVPIPSIQTIR